MRRNDRRAHPHTAADARDARDARDAPGPKAGTGPLSAPRVARPWIEPATEHQRAVFHAAWGTGGRASAPVSPVSPLSRGWGGSAERHSGRQQRSGLRGRVRSASLSVTLARWREGVTGPARPPQSRRQRVLGAVALCLVGFILVTVVVTGVGITLAVTAPVIARLPTTPHVPPPPAMSRLGAVRTPTPAVPAQGSMTPTALATAPPDPYAGLAPDPTLPTVFCPDDATTPTPLPNGQGSCAVCAGGYIWTSQRWTTLQIDQALDQAATTYQVPARLLDAIAAEESSHREEIVSCSGDAGLLQIKIVQWRALAIQVVPACGLAASTDSPWTLQGNADLGAKLVAWYRCYYGWAGDTGGTPAAPGAYTVAWYYQQAGAPWPNALCEAVYHDPHHPEYQALGVQTTQAEQLACPFSAKTADATYLDVLISAYNEGFGAMSSGGITNWGYVNAVLWFIAHEPAML